MKDYYSQRLSSNSLKRCYDIAPPRVRQYLQAELDFVLKHIQPTDVVLELGCGYGRFMRDLLPHASSVVGIDTSFKSLELAFDYIRDPSRLHVIQADAARLAIQDKSVDKVVCIQNGISAFKIEPSHLIRECVRVTSEGGLCVFSSYSDAFWNHRLEWFILQSEEGLLGEIDWSLTSDGVICCKDGFRATTFGADDFSRLCDEIGLDASICEVDESSIFCLVHV